MEQLIIKYKIKSMIDQKLDRDIKKMLSKHSFVFIGSGWNAKDQEVK